MAITVLLTACSANNHSSKELKDTTTKTESVKPAKKNKPKKNTKKVASKKTTDATASQTSQNSATNNDSQPKQQATTSTAQNNQNKTQTNSNQPAQSAAIITTPDQAASLVAHSYGSNSHEAMNVTQEADGYHVYFDSGSTNPVVTVVKPNGDFYDVNGNITSTYAHVSAPNGGDDTQWSN
ncbi:hypothetical protein IV57_GL000076 [Companilactobacillus kimchiensis]|uniref:Uncharacterized protein n=2 Tax=Companilactobacillus kimchiensis TaxID=993692 RepID=A0A0R2LFX0_9LACO|nr:hypothetical protein IV57_GL000076 [Companilactobacillus kimchiensis]